MHSREFWFLASLLGLGALDCGSGSRLPGIPTAAVAPSDTGHVTVDDGVRLRWERIGSGDTVVFINGGPGGTLDWYGGDLGPLAKRHTVILYDQRGSGMSTAPADTNALGIDSHVADLEALRRHFRIERLTLVAHSYGPLLAASYAIAHPDRVQRMVFLGGVAPYRGKFWEEVSAGLNARLDSAERATAAAAGQRMNQTGDIDACRTFWKLGLKQRVARPADVDSIRSAFCTCTPEQLRTSARTSRIVWRSVGDWDLRPKLAAVRTPTLVIHGDQDAIPMWSAEGWVAALPNARLIKVRDAGHFLYVERPGDVWPAIDRFLSGETVGSR